MAAVCGGRRGRRLCACLEPDRAARSSARTACRDLARSAAPRSPAICRATDRLARRHTRRDCSDPAAGTHGATSAAADQELVMWTFPSMGTNVTVAAAALDDNAEAALAREVARVFADTERRFSR